VSERLRVTVLGPTGRLGRAICEAVLDDPGLSLAGCVVRAESAACGQDMGGVLGREPIGCIAGVSLEEAAEQADIVIDASLPRMTVSAAERLASIGGPCLLTGVTGFTEDQDTRLLTASHQLPVLRASNFSLGVAIAEALVRQAAVLPAREWDIEVNETHHKMKTDAPSGTAIMLARAAASRRGVSLEEAAIWSREGTTGPRETGTIGFAVSRGGAMVGEHSVRFLAEMEELTISHRAFDRRVFARGAITAARWMHNAGQGREPGLYSMQDVVSD
jgi:4-hydroxy-tetrahydrodipicolinate reductase